MIYVVVILVAAVGLLFLPRLFHVLSHRRLDRRYEVADIRMVGGPFDGRRANRHDAMNDWPPPSSTACYRRIESAGEKARWMVSIYELRESHNRKLEYHFESERISNHPPPYQTVGVAPGGPG